MRHKGEKQPAHPASTAQQHPPTALQLCWLKPWGVTLAQGHHGMLSTWSGVGFCMHM